jgi:hypothetical protein
MRCAYLVLLGLCISCTTWVVHILCFVTHIPDTFLLCFIEWASICFHSQFTGYVCVIPLPQGEHSASFSTSNSSLLTTHPCTAVLLILIFRGVRAFLSAILCSGSSLLLLPRLSFFSLYLMEKVYSFYSTTSLSRTLP